MNQNQIEAGQKKIGFLSAVPTIKIDRESLQAIESTKIRVNEKDPFSLDKISVAGVRRMPKTVEPLPFATTARINQNLEKI